MTQGKTVIGVSEMHCENCVKRISAALDNAGVRYEVSLPERTVTVEGCENCVATAIAAIEDAGFDPERR